MDFGAANRYAGKLYRSAQRLGWVSMDVGSVVTMRVFSLWFPL